MSVEGIDQTIVQPNVERWLLRRPGQRNALSPAMLGWMTQQCDRLDGEIVVLAGDGPAFCAGFDLGALGATHDDPPDLPLRLAMDAMLAANATFVAAVQGPAIGAGVELVSTCDVIIATQHAYFEVPAGRLGIVYSAPGLQRIAATFGRAATRQMLLLGGRLEAARAHQLGVVELVRDEHELDDAVERTVASLTSGSSMALQAHRDYLRQLPSPDPSLLAVHEQRRVTAFARARAALGR